MIASILLDSTPKIYAEHLPWESKGCEILEIGEMTDLLYGRAALSVSVAVQNDDDNCSFKKGQTLHAARHR